MFRLAVATMAAVMALPRVVLAQAKPDFSGTWTFDEASSDPPPARMGGFGRGDRGGGDRRGGDRAGRGPGGRMGGFTASAMTIKQTGAQISIERTTPMGAQTAVYKLDGSESVNDTPMGKASQSRQKEIRHRDTDPCIDYALQRVPGAK